MSKSKIDVFEIISALFLFAVLILTLIISAAGDHKLFVVLVGMFPVILTVVISLVVHKEYKRKQQLLWLLPIFLSLGFYTLTLSEASILGTLDGEILTGVNFVLSMLYMLFVFYLFDDHKHTKPEPIQLKAEVQELQKPVEKEEEKSIEDYVHSIEDKSKALNFVIGRVYNKYHGGSSDIRDKLRIPTEWYNEFSLIGFGTDHIDFNKLDEIIAKFELHLKQFEKSEFEVFKSKANSLKNLIREPSGKDKVIDVLDHNDKDPVRSYYEGALKFTQKIREAMQNQKLELVENTYIPKSEEEEEELMGQASDKVEETTIDLVNKVEADRKPYPKHIEEVKKEETDNKEKDGPTHP